MLYTFFFLTMTKQEFDNLINNCLLSFNKLIPRRKDGKKSSQITAKELTDLWLKMKAIGVLNDIDLESDNHALAAQVMPEDTEGEGTYFRVYFVILKETGRHVEINSNFTIRRRASDRKTRFHFTFNENLDIV